MVYDTENRESNCLVLASSETEYMRSELQELTNTLGQANYNVKLLHVNITSLELYRTLGTEPYELVWLLGHSGTEGFIFNETIISANELGLFLNQARCKDAVLNACYTVEHVAQIQRKANTNILATIRQEVQDKTAWLSALYLAKRFVETGNLRDTYEAVIAEGNSDYRWFPAPREVGGRKRRMTERRDERGIKELNTAVRNMETTVGKLVVALQGDAWTGQDGLIEITKELRSEVQEVKGKIRSLEEQLNVNRLVLSRRNIITIAIVLFFLVVGILYLTYTLGGYQLAIYYHYPVFALSR